MPFIKYPLLFASLLFFCNTAIQPCSAKEASFYENGREGFYWSNVKSDQKKHAIPAVSKNMKRIFDSQKQPYNAAERFAGRHESQETKAMVERYKRKLKSTVSKQKRDAYQSAASTREKINSSEGDEILIFISSSMPPGLTRSFIKDANKLDCSVKFILNGYPKDGISRFAKTVNEEENKFDLNIDPLLFDAYSVEEVPSMVINRSVKIKNPENTKSALVKAQSATGDDYGDLIKNLTY